MEKEQKERVINALVAFIERVADEKTTSEAAISALPEVINALVNLVFNA